MSTDFKASNEGTRSGILETRNVYLGVIHHILNLEKIT